MSNSSHTINARKFDSSIGFRKRENGRDKDEARYQILRKKVQRETLYRQLDNFDKKLFGEEKKKLLLEASAPLSPASERTPRRMTMLSPGSQGASSKSVQRQSPKRKESSDGVQKDTSLLANIVGILFNKVKFFNYYVITLY